MVITEIMPEDVLACCRKALGLPVAPDDPIDEILLAGLLRRTAGILCPCSRASLRASLLESLHELAPNEQKLPEAIDAVIEGLIIGGDLLELNDVATVDPDVKGTWVFAAPPSFIVRTGGSVFLIGVVPDQDTFLPPSLASRITYGRFTRILEPQPGEDLANDLREEGLQELSEDVWLKAPKPEPAQDALLGMEQHLNAMPPSGGFEGLQILDPNRRVTYYKGRWCAPARHHDGDFVGRRPQDYGAPIWCFVALQNGVPVRLLDLPLKKTRWRACDVAWHLQMAIDSCNANPQLYRRIADGDRVRFDFFSPLPQWSERRLMILGRPEPRGGSLISYSLPAGTADQEERFLQKRLWLARTEDSD